MRPFGSDITNIARNSSNNNNNNSAGGVGNNTNNNNNNNNSNSISNNNNITDNNNNNAINNNENNNNNAGDGNDGNGDDPRIPPHIARIGGIVTFSPIAGRGVIRVVGRCEDAKENNILDLSECELMQIPDAVYHLMRNTELKSCDFSGNVIKKIAPKFALKFSLIKDLNLAHNQLSKLPEELADLKALTHLDISHNSFIVLPPVVFKMPKLRQINASHNAIIEVDTDQVIISNSLELVDLTHNPLGRACHRKLKKANTPFRIEISEFNEEEDW